MQGFFRIIIGLGLLAILWILFLVSKVFLEERPNENLLHIPADANFAMRVDGAAVAKSSLFTVILEANDPALLEIINEQIRKKREYTGPSTKLGIDFLSDILIYSIPFHSGSITGTTYHLERPDLMQKNAVNVFSNNQVYCINQNLGVVLSFSGPDDLNARERLEMIDLAKKIAYEPSDNSLTQSLSKKDTHKFIQLSSKGYLFGKSTLFTQTNAELLLADNGLEIEGELEMNRGQKEVFAKPKYELGKNGLHFFTTLVPEMIQDSFASFCHRKEIELPKIEAIEFNYRGVDVRNTMKGLRISPDMDLLITFESAVNLQQKLTGNAFLQGLGWKMENNQFTNDIKKYNIRRVDDRTVLISQNKECSTQAFSGNQLFELKGDLRKLTNVKGDDGIVGIINGLTIFQTSNDLFQNIGIFSISISEGKPNKAQLKGKITVKKGLYPMNEALKFAIASDFIRVN